MNRVQLHEGEMWALTRVLKGTPDPLDLFKSLCDGGRRPGTVLLESGDTESHRGERSLIVIRSALRIECDGTAVRLAARSPNGRSIIPWLTRRLPAGIEVVARERDGLDLRVIAPEASDEDSRLRSVGVVDVLRLAVKAPRLLETHPCDGPLVVGSLAYDLLAVYESLPPPQTAGIDWPDYEMWLADCFVWVNHRTGDGKVVVQVYGGGWEDDAVTQARGLLEKVSTAYSDSIKELRHTVGAGPRRHPPIPEATPVDVVGGDAVSVDLPDQAYREIVTRLKSHVFAGDVFQIVASRNFSVACEDPIGSYEQLRFLNPSPYMFVVNGTRGTLFGSSPETAVKVHGDPLRVEIRPIAGTRPRGRLAGGTIDRDLDSRMEAELRLNEKELADHMMLVDLARNDIARVSEPGTRYVDRLLSVEKYSHVMHLVSYVVGQLRGDLDALHAYVATMNMGTLVGAPKLKAAQLLREHEVSRRGPYGGAVGYYSRDGSMDTTIVIRSAVVTGGIAHVRAGAGIVFDSSPQAEAEETTRKAEAVLRAVASVPGRR